MDRIAEAFHVVATGDVGFQEADAFLQSIGQGCEPASWDALRGIVAKKDMPVGTRRQAALLLRAMVRRSLDERQTGETLVCVSGDCWAADTPGLNAAVAALVANCLVFHAKRIEEFLAAILKGPGPQVAVLVICAIPAELTDTRTRLPTALKEAVVESLSTPSFSETLQHLTVELQRFDAVTALLPLLIASGGSSPSFRSTFGEAPQPKGLAVLRQQMEPLLLSATRCACSSWGAAGDPPAQVCFKLLLIEYVQW
ncbi:hypothetical protein DIPPA_21056 [Diplonema papillatum]|nr:hypothetical protein DIPPA_21056 [Diplonema papillatum]